MEKISNNNPETETEEVWISRATLRKIEAGFSANCAGGCREPITFAVNRKGKAKVIANVYEAGVWQRVETFHRDCYLDAGEPYGPASENPPMKATLESIALAAAMAEMPDQPDLFTKIHTEEASQQLSA